ncbi:integral membrane sensor signal transduction histidine kinase [Nostoc linckia NIES-25]|nr:integral membrane sensor signal transduction histidine kinase [Nostoc linckia NIES-25]
MPPPAWQGGLGGSKVCGTTLKDLCVHRSLSKGRGWGWGKTIVGQQFDVKLVKNLDRNLFTIETVVKATLLKLAIARQIIVENIIIFTTKPVGKGTGTGMSISYQIISEKHGGKLEFYTKSVQQTEFTIAIRH